MAENDDIPELPAMPVGNQNISEVSKTTENAGSQPKAPADNVFLKIAPSDIQLSYGEATQEEINLRVADDSSSKPEERIRNMLNETVAGWYTPIDIGMHLANSYLAFQDGMKFEKGDLDKKPTAILKVPQLISLLQQHYSYLSDTSPAYPEVKASHLSQYKLHAILVDLSPDAVTPGNPCKVTMAAPFKACRWIPATASHGLACNLCLWTGKLTQCLSGDRPPQPRERAETPAKRSGLTLSLPDTRGMKSFKEFGAAIDWVSDGISKAASRVDKFYDGLVEFDIASSDIRKLVKLKTRVSEISDDLEEAIKVAKDEVGKPKKEVADSELGDEGSVSGGTPGATPSKPAKKKRKTELEGLLG